MSLLIPDEQLIDAKKRIVEREAEKTAATPAPKFEYRERTPAQVFRRMRQSYRNNQSFAPPKPEPEPTFDEPESNVEDPYIESDENDSDTRKAKVSSTTLCLCCGHARNEHHIAPQSHVAAGDHPYYCITPHCGALAIKDGKHAPCECACFRVEEKDVPKLTKPRVGPYDLCGNCGHWKISHCVKSKPGKVSRLKPGELAYRILRKPDGTAYGCKHFCPSDPNCQCNSTSCAHALDDVNFCPCEKFVSPFAKTKAPAKPRGSRKKKTRFRTGGELFPSPAETNNGDAPFLKP
jgi:ribosomal protein L32